MRIAILGGGSIGRRHLRNLRQLGHEDILVFDPVPEARQQVEAEFHLPVADDLAQVWDRKPQVAFVTAPSNLHVPLALEAARLGCHLFIEKPVAASLEGLGDLTAEIERRHLVTMVGCNMRFHPGPRVIESLIDRRAIGEVIAARIQGGSYLPRWRPQQDYRQSYSASVKWGGAILDCIHELDLALWYSGPASLAGAAVLPAKSLGLATDGLAEMILRHDNGVLSSVHLNFVQRDYRRTCQVIGSEGTLYWDFTHQRVDLFGPEGKLAESFPEPEGWQVNQMYVDEVSHFLDCVTEGRPTMNPLAGGIAALVIALVARGPESHGEVGPSPNT